jgi:mannose-1-phosphate guanylyltransferase
LADLLDGNAVRVLGDATEVRAIDSSGVVVTADRAVTVLGVRDIVVVDTGDALLVTTTAHAQLVREARAAWATERPELL